MHQDIHVNRETEKSVSFSFWYVYNKLVFNKHVSRSSLTLIKTRKESLLK